MSLEEKKYHAFLSFRSSDQDEVARVAKYLQDNDLRVFFSPRCITPGENWLEAVEAGFWASRHCVVFLGGPRMGRYQKFERNLAVVRQQEDSTFRTIPVLLSGIQDSDLSPNALDLHSRIDLRQDRESGLKLLVGFLQGVLPEEVVSRSQGLKDEICPYRGLKPYREEDASAFFGQDEFAKRLEDLICTQSFTVLVGPSGSGKTSLVQAGLLPRLSTDERGEREWIFVTVQPDRDPLGRLCSALASWLSQDASWKVQKALEWERDIRAGNLRLSQLVQRVLDVLQVRRMLLVMDPSEELWTWASPDTSQFLEEIFEALNPLSVLLVLRADYYGRALAHPVLGPHLGGRTVFMTRMDRAGLEQTIKDLAAKGNRAFKPALVADLVNELEQAPAGLPLLQKVMKEIWLRRDKDPGLAFADIELIPGVAKSLAEEALPDSPAGREATRRLFLRLVRLEDDGTRVARLRVFWDEINPVFYPLIESLIEKRVVVVDWDKHEKKAVLELGHDDLAQSWDLMKQWTAIDKAFLLWRQKLRWKRRDWEQGRHARELLVLDRQFLEESLTQRETRADDLVDIETLYIEKSSAEYRRRLERRRWNIAISVIVLLAAIVASLFGWNAVRAAARARSVALAAEAARLSDRKVDLALLLSLHASRITATPEARGVTLSLTAGNPALRFFLRPELREQKAHPEEIRATASGPSGLIATGGKGKIFLWDANKGTHRPPLDAGSSEQIVSLAFSPNGFLLASGSKAAGFVHLWNLQNPDKPSEFDLIETDGSTQNLAFDREGKLLAWSTPSGTYIWDLSRGVLVRHLQRGPALKNNWISGVAFGPSGVLASARANSQITLWEPGKGERLLSAPREDSAESILGVTFLPQSGVLVSAGSSFQRWNLVSGQPIGTPCSLLAGPGDEVLSVAFSRDGRLVASGHFDRKIRLWDVSTEGKCQLVTTLSGHSGFIWTLSFGAVKMGEPLTLISGGQGGDLILWEPDPKTSRFSLPLMNLAPEADAIVAASPDGRAVVVGDSRGQLTLFDGANRAELAIARTRYQSSVNHIAFRKDGLALATSGLEGAVHLWDVSHRDLQRLRDPLTVEGLSAGDSILSLAFGERSWIAAGTKNGHLIFWRFEEKAVPAWIRTDAHRGAIQSMAFVAERSPWVGSLPFFMRPLLARINSFFARKSREYLVTGGLDGSLSLWDPENGEKLQTIESAHSESIEQVVAGTDGIFASGSQDRNIRLWRLNRRMEPDGILFLGVMVSGLAFSPQGDLLAASLGESSKNELALWDLKTRIPLGRGFQTPEEIGSVAFGPSGGSLYLAGKGISAWWNLQAEAWSSRACEMVRRDFSPIEREKYLRISEPSAVCRRDE